MTRIRIFLLAAAAAAAALPGATSPTAAAEPVLVQCGREYQAAKAAGTLNGADWNRYRTECSARLKVAPAAASPTATAPAVAAAPAAPAAAPAAVPASLPEPPAPSGGLAAMRLRQKQCGADWRAQKATLVAQTPGLTWPRYWSQCNTRLKAAGH